MSETAIKIEGLGKHYRLGTGPRGKGDFRDAASAAAAAWLRRLTGRPPDVDEGNGDERDLWALRDVSFEVKRGEVVGLIGHNGAGKSTLLRILSRVTDPSEGRAWFEGRLGSLLEVGTGFHPELSGRENVYLSGAVLGMARKEIDDKYEQIVEFSEIGRFIDTPVKRYSSGMYVRLGFSVAAHLRPEILVVDEVLAVGDAAFQKKCMDKMKEVSTQGRTILFVSHNMGSIQSLCDRCVVLRHGRVFGEGSPADAVRMYLESTTDRDGGEVAGREDRQGRGGARAVRLSVHNTGHEDASGVLVYGQTAELHCEVDRLVPDLSCSFTILNHLTTRVCRFSCRTAAEQDEVVGGKRFTCVIPDWAIVPGRYHVNVSLHSPAGLEDAVDGAASFDVEHGQLAGRPLAREQRGVIFAPPHRWQVPAAAAVQ